MNWSNIGGRWYDHAPSRDQTQGTSSAQYHSDIPKFSVDDAGMVLLTTKDGERRFHPEENTAKLNANLRKSEDQLRQAQNANSALSYSYDHLVESYKQREDENGQLVARRAEAERDLHTAHLTIGSLRQELDSCKDDLFRLQPQTQIPDTTILKDFQTLSQHIASWIDDELSRYEGLHPAAGSRDLFYHGGAQDSATFLHRFPQAGEYLVRFHIHRWLHAAIYGKGVYLFGLSKEQTETMNVAEQGMGNLRPQRDSATISAWRSETLSAIAGGRNFTHRRDQYVEHSVVPSLFKYLTKFLPILEPKSGSMVRLREQVVLPAVDFATRIQLSASTYGFNPDPGGNPFEGYREKVALGPKLLHDYKIIDVHSRKTLKPDSPVVLDKNGSFGYVVMQVEPGLMRVNEGKDNTTLRQPVFLTKLHQPLGKRK